MKFTDTFIQKPVQAIVLTVALLIVGTMCYFKLPSREFPVINLPIITITTNFPGASPATMEGYISNPIEDSLTGVQGIDYVSTQNEQGYSTITVWLDIGHNINDAMTEIMSRVSSVSWKFPPGTLTPSIVRTTKGTPVIFVALGSNDLTIEQISDYFRRILEPQFSGLPGVMDLFIQGERDYAMRLWFDPKKLVRYNMTMPEVVRAVQNNSLPTAVGQLKNTVAQYTMSINSSLSTAKGYNDLVLKSVDGQNIKLGDVGHAAYGSRFDNSNFLVPGYKNVVVFGLVPNPTANSIKLADQGLALLKKVESKFPPGISARVIWNTTTFSVDAIKLVFSTVWLAIGCVVIVIFLFLGSMRSLFIPVLVIPCSLIGTCILMYAMGFSINTITLLAFVLAIGLVVDDAIVVVENIHRNMAMGLGRMRSAIRGTREINNSVVTMTLVVIVVIVPIGFSGGLTGALFKEFALTLASTVFLSMVFALTLTPMLASRTMVVSENPKALSNRIEHFVETFSEGYRQVLDNILHLKYFAIVLIILLGGYCFWLLNKIPSELVPDENQGVILINAMAPTSASIGYMNKHAQMIGDIFKQYKEGEDWGVVTGFQGNYIQNLGWVVLRPQQAGDLTENQLIPLVQAKAAKIPGVRAFAFNRPALADVTGFDAPVQFVIQTTGGYAQLDKVVHEMEDAAKKNPKLLNVDTDLRINKPSVDITIDRMRAGSLGVSVAQISNTLEYLFAKPIIGWYANTGQSYPVIPQVYDALRIQPNQLQDIYVRTVSGGLVPISSLVNYKTVVMPQKLNHFQKIRSATVTAQLAHGYTIGQALNYLEHQADKILPNNMTYDFASTSRQYMKAAGKMAAIFAIALAGIYLLLVVKFNSFLEPLVVMFCVPLSSAGALTAMFLTGNTRNIFTEIGLVMLVGLISKHGILIVDFAQQQQEEGESIVNSVLDAAKIRLRPVLMTTCAMVFGAVPLVLAQGAGSENLKAIGWVIIGGLSFGSLMTLFVVPCMYCILIRRPRRQIKPLEDHL